MRRQSILHRKGRRKVKKEFELQLTSMMDMLIILVVFLLKSYAANSIAFATSQNIKLPNSTAEELPADAVNLLIEPEGLVLDHEKILGFKPSPVAAPSPSVNTAANGAPTPPPTYEIEPFQLGDSGRRILPLYDSLVKNREKAELIMSKAVWKDETGKEIKPKPQGVLVIHADKSVRYELLRKIMYTAGAAEFKTFKLVTVKKDGT